MPSCVLRLADVANCELRANEAAEGPSDAVSSLVQGLLMLTVYSLQVKKPIQLQYDWLGRDTISIGDWFFVFPLPPSLHEMAAPGMGLIRIDPLIGVWYTSKLLYYSH